MQHQLVQERERWKREANARLDEARSQAEAASREQLNEASKKAISENTHMAAEISYQSRQARPMLSMQEWPCVLCSAVRAILHLVPPPPPPLQAFPEMRILCMVAK
jgi:hypothetical protein